MKPADLGMPPNSATVEENADGPEPRYPESYTWTFYRIVTTQGTLVLRWLGESNGYYSERVYVAFKEGE